MNDFHNFPNSYGLRMLSHYSHMFLQLLAIKPVFVHGLTFSTPRTFNLFRNIQQ